MNFKSVEFESIKFDFYWSTKSSSTEEEFEDAFTGPHFHGSSIRICIADGATESQFSREWAQNICDSYCMSDNEIDFIDNARSTWIEAVDLKDEGRNWYQQQSIIKGAHATYLGLSITDDMQIVVEQLGDCNLFIVEDRRPLFAWPIRDSDSFDNTPDLVSSLSHSKIKEKRLNWHWQKDQRLIMATDTVAKYFLDNCIDTRSELLDLEKIFQSIVNARGHQISDDDLTLIEISRLDD